MNFAYMPETGWRYGYYATLAGMVCSPFSCGLPSNGKAGSGKAAGGIRPRSRLRLTRDIAEINVKQRPA